MIMKSKMRLYCFMTRAGVNVFPVQRTKAKKKKKKKKKKMIGKRSKRTLKDMEEKLKKKSRDRKRSL